MPTEEQPNNIYDQMGIDRPEIISHGVTPDDIRANMKRVSTTNWRLQGNQLICDTELGLLSQTIPTDYILRGTDESGLPILEKVV